MSKQRYKRRDPLSLPLRPAPQPSAPLGLRRSRRRPDRCRLPRLDGGLRRRGGSPGLSPRRRLCLDDDSAAPDGERAAASDHHDSADAADHHDADRDSRLARRHDDSADRNLGELPETGGPAGGRADRAGLDPRARTRCGPNRRDRAQFVEARPRERPAGPQQQDARASAARRARGIEPPAHPPGANDEGRCGPTHAQLPHRVRRDRTRDVPAAVAALDAQRRSNHARTEAASCAGIRRRAVLKSVDNQFQKDT